MLKKCHTVPIYFAILVFFTLVSGYAFGSGFAILEHGGKATAMAGAFAAQADDPTALCFNPAGIVQLDGFNTAFNAYFILPGVTFKSSSDDSFLGTSPGNETSPEKNLYFVPAIYATCKLSEKWSIGICEYPSFALENKWPKTWEGRYTPGGVKASVVSMDVNPSVAFQPYKKLGIAFGTTFQRVTAELHNMILVGAEDYLIKAKGDDDQWGWNFGLIYFLNDNINIGITYRSAIDHKFTGVSLSSDLDILNTKNAKLRLHLPGTAFFAVSLNYDPMTVEFDLQWTDWSTAEQLKIDTEMGTVLDEVLDWEDAYSFRFGGEYRLNDTYAVRAGYLYEERCIPEENITPFFSDSIRHYYSAGFGYKKKKMSIDLAYGYVLIKPRQFDSHFGEYARPDGSTGKLFGKFIDGDVHILNLTFGYHF